MVCRKHHGPSVAWTLSLLLAAGSCTRPNPAFVESDSSEAAADSGLTASSSDVSNTSVSDTDADASATSQDTSDSTAGDGDGDSDSAGNPACESIPPSAHVLAYFDDLSLGDPVECGIYKESTFITTGATAAELLLAGPCEPDCTNCEGRAFAFGIEPTEPQADPEVTSECVHVVAEAPQDNVPASHCTFSQVSFWVDGGPEFPVLSISTDGGVPPAIAALEGPGGSPFSIATGTEYVCGCEDVGWCCKDDNPPQGLKLLPSGSEDWAYPQQEVSLNWGGLSYTFLNARSYNSGECDVPPQITWVLQLDDPLGP